MLTGLRPGHTSGCRQVVVNSAVSHSGLACKFEGQCEVVPVSSGVENLTWFTQGGIAHLYDSIHRKVRWIQCVVVDSAFELNRAHMGQ